MSDCTIRGCRNINTVCADCGRTLITRILPPSMAWIDVKDQTPAIDKWIIGGNYSRVDFGVILKHDLVQSREGDKCLEMYLPQEKYLCMGITHWIAMPEPPGKKKRVIGDILEEYEFNGEKIKK